MSLPRYPGYKGLADKWFGELPAHWNATPLKFVVNLRSGGTPSKSNIGYWDGTVPWASSKDLKSEVLSDTQDHITSLAVDEGAAELVPTGSVLIVVRGMILAHTFPVVKALVPMAINQDLKALTPTSTLDSNYLGWLLRGTSSETLARTDEAGHGTKVLRMEAWTSIPLPIPPVAEQTLIVAFLERETAKIDELVAEQRRLMELLKEKRQAVISHAVTKGLNPHAPMKPSGIEWLGDVPAHWEVMPLKHLIAPGSSISYGIVQPGEPVDDGVPFVQTTNMTLGRLGLEELQRTTPAIAAQFPRSRLAGGEVILGIRASIGAAHVVPPTLAGANLSRGVARIETNHRILNSYLVAFFSSGAAFQYWQLCKQGSTFNEVSIETVRELRVGVPPLDEQQAITAHLDAQLDAFSALTGEARRAIDLLQERRTALISAAVTGQIDVRNLSKGQVA